MANWLVILLLGILGLATGGFCNYAIYSWRWYSTEAISPWQKSLPNTPEKKWVHYLPVIGWLNTDKQDQRFQHWFSWTRPMLIEFSMMLFAPFFFFWFAGGGLLENSLLTPGVPQKLAWCWFVLFYPFIALLIIGTFIDFDERTIPDQVTVSGTLYAMICAALLPVTRLPEIVVTKIVSIDYLSPNIGKNYTLMPADIQTLLLMLFLFAVWIWALLPKFSPFRVGWWKAIRFMPAAIFYPPRRNKCALRVRQRTLPGLTKVLICILVLGWLGIFLTWQFLGNNHWESLTGSILGMVFGGGLIWGIRIVGTLGLGKEAMGFGDVTLMAMIGATLGWQASLLSFVCTIWLIVILFVVQVLVTGSSELAFGPYLCGGAIALIFVWAPFWGWAEKGLFSFGPTLIYILLGAGILMFWMLAGLNWMKRLFGQED